MNDPYWYLNSYEAAQKQLEEEMRRKEELLGIPQMPDPLAELETSIESAAVPPPEHKIPEPQIPEPPLTDPRHAMGSYPSSPPPGLEEHKGVVAPYEPWFHLKPPTRGHQLSTPPGKRLFFRPGPTRRLGRLSNRMGTRYCNKINDFVYVSVCMSICDDCNPDTHECEYGQDQEETEEED